MGRGGGGVRGEKMKVARRWKIRGNVVNSHEGIDVLRSRIPSFPSSYIFIGKTRGSDTLYTKADGGGVSPRRCFVHVTTDAKLERGRVDGRGRRVEREEGRGGWGFRVLNILAWRDLKQQQANDEIARFVGGTR